MAADSPVDDRHEMNYPERGPVDEVGGGEREEYDGLELTRHVRPGSFLRLTAEAATPDYRTASLSSP